MSTALIRSGSRFSNFVNSTAGDAAAGGLLGGVIGYGRSEDGSGFSGTAWGAVGGAGLGYAGSNVFKAHQALMAKHINRQNAVRALGRDDLFKTSYTPNWGATLNKAWGQMKSDGINFGTRYGFYGATGYYNIANKITTAYNKVRSTLKV